MSSFQEKFTTMIKNIYLNVFNNSIESEINTFLKAFDNKNILYKNKSFILVETDQDWKVTEEAFVWARSLKILTDIKIEEIVFVILELKGYTNLSFWVSFPRNDFSIDHQEIDRLDLTYEITDDIKAKFGLDEILPKPFELKS
jgi:hypothetical protein